jgi:hypothetical protein
MMCSRDDASSSHTLNPPSLHRTAAAHKPPQLRFNKVSELIHNSTNHRNLERACVTVHFHEIIDRVGGDDGLNVLGGGEWGVGGEGVG